MKVRARVKAPEHLPEWAKCCEAPLTKVAEQMEYFIVDLSQTRSGEARCTACGAPLGHITQVIGYFPLAEWIVLDILDLDEGPLEATA